jgi:hypothetical protein
MSSFEEVDSLRLLEFASQHPETKFFKFLVVLEELSRRNRINL